MIIKNAKIITFDDENSIIESGDVVINKQGVIETVKGSNEGGGPENGDEVINAHGRLLMPGNIIAHTHFYGAYSRGMYIPGDAPNAFPQILEKQIQV